MNDNKDIHQYDDIINLPHHQSATRPHMSNYDRAAQFSPFAALTGHEAAIKETARQTDEKLMLSDEVIAELKITLVDGKTGELTLEANRSGTDEGQFGTITVTISTSNYQDITLTVNIFAKNKLTPVMDGKITASKITYGQALSDSSITGKMKDPNTGDEVNGTFSWKQPGDTILDASTLGHSVEWTFTPKDGNTYTEVTGTATVQVDKATKYGKVSMAGYTYGQAPSTPTLTDRTGDAKAQVTYSYAAAGSGSVQT